MKSDKSHDVNPQKLNKPKSSTNVHTSEDCNKGKGTINTEQTRLNLNSAKLKLASLQSDT